MIESALKAVAQIEKKKLAILLDRIRTIPLFAHAYSHHLNMRLGNTSPSDMLEFAAKNHLVGLNIHVEDGEGRSLQAMKSAERKAFGVHAKDLGLPVHLEVSATSREVLESAIEIANDIGSLSIRCYARHEGRVSEVISKTIADLALLDEIEPAGGICFKLEQHEDLKARELVEIVEAVGNPRLSLLFDFGNSINAYETPEAALDVMADQITEAHIKDVKAGADRGGWSQIACRSGEGEIDFPTLICKLLLLGSDRPQVAAFALQEENGMMSPAFRFADEEADPFIPWRAPSTTDPDEQEDLALRLISEKEDAARQVAYVRQVLNALEVAVLARLGQHV